MNSPVSTAPVMASATEPAADTLADCERLLAELKTLVIRATGEEIDDGVITRFLMDLHTVKGALSFLGHDSLVHDLHEIEDVLTLGARALGAVSVSAARARNRVSQLRTQGAPSVRPNEGHRFGESLWWTHELTQSLAIRVGKRVFVLVDGGDVPVSDAAHRVLQGCLVHLARNAIIHGIETTEVRTALGKPEIGLITVSANRAGGELTVRVSDNGSGMRQAERAEAFQIGYSSRAEADSNAGMGLGLAAVKERVESLGGAIHTESEAGIGSAFILTLPA